MGSQYLEPLHFVALGRTVRLHLRVGLVRWLGVVLTKPYYIHAAYSHLAGSAGVAGQNYGFDHVWRRVVPAC